MSDNQEIIIEAYKDKMKKRLYGLLKEREKNGEWEKFLDTILIELEGYNDSSKTIDYYTLYASRGEKDSKPAAPVRHE